MFFGGEKYVQIINQLKWDEIYSLKDKKNSLE